MAKKASALTVDGLREIGGILTGEAVPRGVTWKITNDDGTETEHTFIVGVVKLGVAATERIWRGQGDKSSWALAIHEAIRLGEDFTERISYEDACNLDNGLLAALSEATRSVNPEPKESPEGKD